MTRGRRRPSDSYQGNAADPASVKRADRLVKERERQERLDMAELLSLPAGRRVLWMVLEHCAVFRDIWDPSVRMHYMAGQQEVGHYLLAQIVSVDDTAWIKMQQENLQRSRREAATVEAMETDTVLTETLTEGDEHIE